MTLFQKIGTLVIFGSLPLVLFFKGKGLVISYILFFCVYGVKPLLADIRARKKIGDYLSKGHEKYTVGIAGLLIIYSLILNPSSILPFIRCGALVVMGYGMWRGVIQLNRSSQEQLLTIFLKSYVVSITLYATLILSHHIFHFIFPMIDSAFNKERFLRGTVILVTFTVPALLTARRIKFLTSTPKHLITAIIGLLFFILLHARPDAARVAVVIALVVGGLLWVRPSLNRWIFYTIAAAALVFPFLCLYAFNEHTLGEWMRFLPTSYQHRLQIWHIISEKITENFLSGHGFDAATTLQDITARCAYFNPIAYLEQKASANALINGSTPYSWGGVVCYKESAIGSHPHNGFIQIWYEFGLAGILFFIYGFWRLCASLMTYNRLYQIAGFTIVIIYGMFLMVSFNIWQNWLLSLGGFTIILFRLIHHLYPRGI